MNTLIPLQVREMKAFLKCLRPDVILCPGLGNPHPYRGGWFELAFAPKTTTTVRELLEDLNRAQTTRLEFPEGGQVEHLYQDTTNVFVASPNHFGTPLTMEYLLLSVEGWLKIGEGFNRNH